MQAHKIKLIYKFGIYFTHYIDGNRQHVYTVIVIIQGPGQNFYFVFNGSTISIYTHTKPEEKSSPKAYLQPGEEEEIVAVEYPGEYKAGEYGFSIYDP